MPTIPLEPVDGVTITTLMDNAVDLLLLDQGPAKRPGFVAGADTPRVRPVFLEREMADPLLAEHGFSMLLTVASAGREHRVLFDAGRCAHRAAWFWWKPSARQVA